MNDTSDRPMPVSYYRCVSEDRGTLKRTGSAGIQGHALLWMDKILHHFETMGNHNVCWYLQGNQTILGFLGWCEMDFATIHSSRTGSR